MAQDAHHLGEDRALARRLFDAGLAAAMPEAAVARALADLAPPDGRTLVIAGGKAALRMLRGAAAWLEALPARPAILAVTNRENLLGEPGAPPDAEVIAAGHPVPDEGGLRAARRATAMLRSAAAGDLVLVLLSGGASAMLPAPAEGLTLADKAEVSRLLLASGASIEEVNLVRQHLSTLKGGGMARLAAPAHVAALIVSDVIGDDPRAIASGPTAAPLGTRAEARALCRDLRIWDRLPGAAGARLEAPEEPAPAVEADSRVIGSNALSLEAMAAACPEAVLHRAPLTGDVAAAAARLLALPRGVHLLGGETTVRVTGGGLGGRNQELALRVALGGQGRFVLLGAGTDGRDGPTAAAGAVVDEGTAARIRAAGLDPEARLADNDAHRALAASGDLLVTGGTGTNVADLQVLLRR